MTEKIYKIINRDTGKPAAFGYKSRKTWVRFPTQIVKDMTEDQKKNHYVEEYEMVAARGILLGGQNHGIVIDYAKEGIPPEVGLRRKGTVVKIKTCNFPPDDN